MKKRERATYAEYGVYLSARVQGLAYGEPIDIEGRTEESKKPLKSQTPAKQRRRRQQVKWISDAKQPKSAKLIGFCMETDSCWKRVYVCDVTCCLLLLRTHHGLNSSGN